MHKPSSIENGKVIYRHSVTTNQHPQLTGTFKTEWEITVEKK